MSEMEVQPTPAASSFPGLAAVLGLPLDSLMPGGSDPVTLAAWAALEPAIERDAVTSLVQSMNRDSQSSLGTRDIGSYVATDDNGAAALQDPGTDPPTIAL